MVDGMGGVTSWVVQRTHHHYPVIIIIIIIIIICVRRNASCRRYLQRGSEPDTKLWSNGEALGVLGFQTPNCFWVHEWNLHKIGEKKLRNLPWRDSHLYHSRYAVYSIIIQKL